MDSVLELQTDNLVKAFGRHYALRGVNLRLEQGEGLVIIGPNGAGKTTLLRCLAGLSKPSAGKVFLRGQELTTGTAELRRLIGFVSHETLLYDDLTPAENLRFYGRLYDVADLEARLDQLLGEMGIRQRSADPVRTLSRGMRQRLALARALLHQPKLVLLDEPHTGLDIQATELLDGVLREMAASGRTVLLTTHDLSTAVRSGSRLAVLVDGRIAFETPKGALSELELRDLYRGLMGVSK